jgi:transcriptional regulator with XRE-family HTH domain
MLNSQLIVQRIKQKIQENKSSVKQLCDDLEIGINTLSRLSKGQEMSYQRLAQIADYLDCSVDYLLGREKPRDVYSFAEETLITAFRKLSPTEQGQVIGFAVGLSNKP